MKQKLVVLTGAGISAESGLQTFRDADGLWEGHSIEDVATIRGWRKNPQLVLDFYNERREKAFAAEPNAAHISLATLEELFDVTIITQNVDDLHEAAGSSKVVHLHGELRKKRSSRNPNLIYDWPEGEVIKIGDKCEDGSQMRPHIVWFGESVPMLTEAARISHNSDIFVVIGTSLAVYPAASLIDYPANHVPKFIIDRKIPDIDKYQNLTKIEKSATEGIVELTNKLIELL